MDYLMDQRCGGCTLEKKNCRQCVGTIKAGIRRRKNHSMAMADFNYPAQSDTLIDDIPE